MGASLSFPITTMHVERHHTPFFTAACAHVHGWRLTQEDAHNVIECVNSAGISLFGVYDGHGGHLASRYLQEAIPNAFKAITNIYDYPAITSLMLQLDAEFLTKAHQDGTTCCIVLSQLWNLQTDNPIAVPAEEYLQSVNYDLEYLKKHTAIKLVSINIGDSRAMIIDSHAIYKLTSFDDKKTSNTVTVPSTTSYDTTITSTTNTTVTDKKQPDYIAITRDHKPQHEIERQRIVNAMGTVSSNRVDGNLALSRAIGDAPYKNNPHLIATEQKVIAVPDFEEHTIYWGDVLLVCCDGIFEADRMTYAEVSRIVCKSIQDIVNVGKFILNDDDEDSTSDNQTNDHNNTQNNIDSGNSTNLDGNDKKRVLHTKTTKQILNNLSNNNTTHGYESIEWDPAVVARDLIEQSLLAESKDNHSSIVVSFRLPTLTKHAQNVLGSGTTLDKDVLPLIPSTIGGNNIKITPSILKPSLLSMLPTKECIPGPFRVYAAKETAWATAYKQDLTDNGYEFEKVKPIIDVLDDVIDQYTVYDPKHRQEIVEKLADVINTNNIDEVERLQKQNAIVGPILIKKHFAAKNGAQASAALNLNTYFNQILVANKKQSNYQPKSKF